MKSFASGILLPKNYIWPVNADLYLLPHTSIVADAHQQGLEVYASDFANDFSLAYNYSYDRVAEVLSFIDNSQFSVDGLLTDFPVSSSEAIGTILFSPLSVEDDNGIVFCPGRLFSHAIPCNVGVSTSAFIDVKSLKEHFLCKLCLSFLQLALLILAGIVWDKV